MLAYLLGANWGGGRLSSFINVKIVFFFFLLFVFYIFLFSQKTFFCFYFLGGFFPAERNSFSSGQSGPVCRNNWNCQYNQRGQQKQITSLNYGFVVINMMVMFVCLSFGRFIFFLALFALSIVALMETMQRQSPATFRMTTDSNNWRHKFSTTKKSKKKTLFSKEEGWSSFPNCLQFILEHKLMCKLYKTKSIKASLQLFRFFLFFWKRKYSLRPTRERITPLVNLCA